MMALPGALLQGLERPVADAQQVFRAVLQAMAHPGRPIELPVAAPPVDLMPATALVLLTLTDADTPVWWAPSASRSGTAAWLRFHTGAPCVEATSAAAFAVVHGAAPAVGPADFDRGTEEQPERSCTLLWQVRALDRGPPTVWSGPGIAALREVRIDGLPEGFWPAWARQHAGLPRGVDVLLLCGHRCMGLPRSTRVQPTEGR
jgi:alpha-D-ribose 1-methylphosphonate 5-triphosphate synthase subunit PhnH